jgi:hypothetical protein
VRHAVTPIGLDGSKESRAAAEMPQARVNVAHHAEVAILDENALKAANGIPAPGAGAARAGLPGKRLPNSMSVMVFTDD